jgi:peptidase M28-like protein
MIAAAMDPRDIVTGLSRVAPRGPGTDAERRAAQWLAQVLREDLDREVITETVWVRPQTAAVLGLHALAGVAASLVAASAPAVGLGLAAAALLSWTLDQLGWFQLGRRLTPARATQNLVSPPTAATRAGRQRIVRLVITAAYDAPRTGVVRREPVRQMVGRLRELTGGRLPGAAALVALCLAAVAGLAAARLGGGSDPGWIGAVQLVPTILLLAALGVAVDSGLSHPGPGANDPGSGAGVAIALAAALDRDPPRHMGVELVLAGAGQGSALGMREFARARRKRYRPEATAVVNLAACGRGRPRWWISDGPLLPYRYHPRLRDLAAQAGGAPHRGREATGGWRARLVGWPAITIGCLDGEGWPPGSGQSRDTEDLIDPASLRGALDVALRLVRALDDDLSQRATPDDAPKAPDEAPAPRAEP